LKLQITINGKTYEVEVEVMEEDESPHPLSYTAYHPAQAVQPPIPAGHAAPSFVEDAKVCLSPVTGLVIKVQVQPGQSVAANDPVMVLEAMKMETNVMAPCDGIVKAVHVAAGDSVRLNQLLVEFE
jgi:methylmalonyl-CoA carboxyltransferase small subunit